MDPELEQTADEGDVAEQHEEWTEDPDDQPVVPDADRREPVQDDLE